MEQLLQKNIPLPPNFGSLDPTIQEKVIKYLNHLNTFECKAYIIGIDHLGSSFNLVKSNGYIDWLKQNT